MIFNGYAHEGRYAELLKRDRTGVKDRERQAFFFIFSSMPGLFDEIENYYDFKDHLVTEIRIRYLSSGEFKMIKLAANLYNGWDEDCTPVELFSGLDENNFNIAINAIRIRFGVFMDD
jgi:hypothetical protein